MSGIYIPMKIPTEGFITVTITSDGRVVGNSQKINGKFEYLDNKDIASAIPVPDHGGLVDLKAPFCAQYYDEMTEEWVKKEGTVEDVLWSCMVYDMPPVVIPAEKEPSR